MYPKKLYPIGIFDNFVRENFLADLQGTGWFSFYNSSHIDEATTIFNQIVSDVASQHAPISKKKVKGNCTRWVSGEFLIAVKERDFILKVASRSKNSDDWATFKAKWNSVNKLKK